MSFIYSAQSHAIESVIDSQVGMTYEVNDNIDLVQEPTGNASSLVVSPSTSLSFKEVNWNASLNAGYTDRNFSNSSKNNSDDILLNSAGSYQSEKNVFSASVDYIQYSSLSSESGDFGASSEVVERTTISYSPSYQRLITDRLSLSLRYSSSDVSFDKNDLGFVPHVIDTGTTTISYSLSERTQISGIASLTDYESDDKSNEFQSVTTRVSLQHNFTSIMVGNFSYGTSRRDSIQRTSRSVPFFGTIIITNAESDFSSDGKVYDASITHTLDGGNVTYGVSRSDTIDSFGAVSVLDMANISYSSRLTEIIRLSIGANYKKTVAIASSPTFSDMETWVFEPRINYALDRHWNLNASYRYAKRRFLTSSLSADSNRISVGLEYKFPTISTF